MSAAPHEGDPAISGPCRIVERPRDAWIGREGYALPERPTRADYYRLAAWVEERGGSAPYVSDDGVLVISNYLDDKGEVDGTRYHEFVGGDCFLMYDRETGEFSGISLGGYDVEPLDGGMR